jgi:hypothetical protein
LLPGFYRKRVKDQIRQIFLIIFYSFENSNSKRVLSPIYFLNESPNGARVEVIIPLYFHYSKNDRYIAIYPFYIVYRKATLEVKFRLPFYYHQKDTNEEIKYFFPFYGRITKGEKKTYFYS